MTLLAGETADLVRKRLDQIFEPGLGIPLYGLAVADQEDVEVEIQKLAHATPKASRVIHYAFRHPSRMTVNEQP